MEPCCCRPFGFIFGVGKRPLPCGHYFCTSASQQARRSAPSTRSTQARYTTHRARQVASLLACASCKPACLLALHTHAPHTGRSRRAASAACLAPQLPFLTRVPNPSNLTRLQACLRTHLVQGGVGVLRRGQAQTVDLHKLKGGHLPRLAATKRRNGRQIAGNRYTI